MKQCVMIVLGVILVLWLIKISEIILGLDLAVYGIYPRDMDKLTGVITAPLIHGSFEHLFANTLPLFIMGSALIYNYPKAVKYVIPIIYLGSGVGVWLFARESYHIGASGVAHGMMFFIFIAGILRNDKPSAALALIIFFLYGGMLVSIFPTQAHISFESHFFGAVAGTICAFLFRDMDPKKAEKKYSWELEEEDLLEFPDDDNEEKSKLVHDTKYSAY
ncbi:rhomboid family intramembrane serine protease [Candidatus Venteria ishoeyi]|uniref:rhomboid family intramembrane serine protease n=1 Tax=Candidatus Venteria ishoeyi TaxID=1899563 RepID=UPI0025A4FF38|nr:rhomboid family intramembrane serine protease [Candidatus Venteria ishoeyi]MDM8546883.1 rhomboid family intramembrane serine protease [Candidatus Venteria ishoeyi]